MTGVISMSELNNASQALDLGIETGEFPASPGKLLRAAREAAGVHIAALAGSLKVSVNKLEALENDDFSVLPDAVFARALASSICRALGFDATAVLKLMPKNEVANFSTTSTSINAKFKDGSRKIGRNSFLEHLTRPVSVAVVILLLGVLALLFVPFSGESPAISNKNSQLELNVPESEAVIASTSSVVSLLDATPAAKLVAEDSIVPKTVSSISAQIGAAFPDTVAPPVPAGLLEFRALGESWVQVRDATKMVVFERTLVKGQTASAMGTLPLTVVVGRADATEVFVRGKVFDLASVVKENVARFEVKQ
ncbi:helix-turn-helix domain-containing protein [Simplicispira psychrophila]|uniref:helix-turn-helix domain-containing protein n=1 Tax=Simplicispira psychrophila TaxID=80882 RepID=UPI0009FCDD7E|nr:helix-turn-helix domain-containing protein [Simplicispira psychrophila]